MEKKNEMKKIPGANLKFTEIVILCWSNVIFLQNLSLAGSETCPKINAPPWKKILIGSFFSSPLL